MPLLDPPEILLVPLDDPLNLRFESLDRLSSNLLDLVFLPFLLTDSLSCQPSFTIFLELNLKSILVDSSLLVCLLLLRPNHHAALLRFSVVIEVISTLQEDPMLSLLHGMATELNFLTFIIALCIAKLRFDAAVNVILIINPI